jgi:nitrite reductase/ring-hydroxylating ferredoxin subunit
MSDGFVRVGRVKDFPERRGKAVLVDGVPVAVFREGSRFVAMADTCPHMRASLSAGRFDDTHVECGMHKWRFDVATGKSGSRTGAAVRVHEVRVSDGGVYLRRREPKGTATATGSLPRSEGP